ncbi:unnamed protein product, partial [Arabidopsis halleri]
PKVKLFLWKALQGALLTGQQLQDRHISVDLAYNKCGEPESILHLLFQCSFAQQVWAQATFKLVFPSLNMDCVRSGVLAANQLVCLPPSGVSSCPLGPWICWNLWKTRNQKVFNNRVFSAQETCLKAIVDAKEWGQAQQKTVGDPHLSTPASARISHPLVDWHGVSCRSDAAWRADLKVAGLGWVSSSTEFGITSSVSHSAICENDSKPLMAECLAGRAAILDAVNSGMDHFLLESDCQQLVGAINSRSVILEIHGVLADILISISSFSSFLCRFILRSSNVVADTLAKHCLSLYGQNIG